MTQFVFTEVVNSPLPEVTSAALGVDASHKLSDNDIGKPVKLAANNNYVVCSAGDEIEGFFLAIEPSTVNDGFSFGSVQKNKRFVAKVDAATAATCSVGTYVVAGASSALGTKDAYPFVKSVAAQNLSATPPVLGPAGLNHKWRVIRVVSGTGVAGDLVLIERV